MMTLYSETELLALWRLRRGWESLQPGCSIHRTDAVELDDALRSTLRSRYLQLLDSGPLHLLPVRNLAAQVIPALTADGAAEVRLPAGVRRVAEVRMEGWMRPARIITDPQAPEARAQANMFARGGSCDPVAVLSHSRLLLYSPPEGQSPAMESLLCVVEPEPDRYELDDAALEMLIPPLEP